MAIELTTASAADIASAVREGKACASDVVEATLAGIRMRGQILNAFTAVTEERARADMHRLKSEDLSAEADAWEYDADGNIRIVGTNLTVQATPADRP